MIQPFIVAALMRIKGGGLGFIRNKIKNKIIHRLLDGKILSSVGFGVVCGFLSHSVPAAAAGCLAWLVAVAPSIGEEIGAVGGIKGNWPSDPHSWFGSKLLKGLFKWPRVWGWVSGTLRGTFCGVCLFVGTGIPQFILMGSLFPLSYFVGVSIWQMRTGQRVVPWDYGEWIYGFILGLAFLWRKKNDD